MARSKIKMTDLQILNQMYQINKRIGFLLEARHALRKRVKEAHLKKDQVINNPLFRDTWNHGIELGKLVADTMYLMDNVAVMKLMDKVPIRSIKEM
jgi:hypothetical protein